MTPIVTALISLWRSRQPTNLPYLLANDTRGYLAEVPASVDLDGLLVPVHLCRNECALRRFTEAERESGVPTPKIIISRMQLEPDHVPDIQASSSKLRRTLAGSDLAELLGVDRPRPMLDRLPI